MSICHHGEPLCPHGRCRSKCEPCLVGPVWHLVSWRDHTHVALYCAADGNAPGVDSTGDVDVATCVACLDAAAAHARLMIEAVERRRAQLGQGSG